MKKWIALVLALCCLCSTMALTSCGAADGLFMEIVGDTTLQEILDDIFPPRGDENPDEGEVPGGGNEETPGGNKNPGGNETPTPGGNNNSGESVTPDINDHPGGNDNTGGNNNSGDNNASDDNEQSYAEKGDTPTINGQTASELYTQAMDKLDLCAHNYQSTAVIDMLMTYNGQTAKKSMTFLSHECDGNVHTNVWGDRDLTGGLASEAWYVDGWLYQIRDGQKIKVEMSMQDYLDKYYNAQEGEERLMNIPESWLEDVGFFSTEKGGYIRVVLKGEEMLEALNRVGLGASGEISNVTYDIHFNHDGELTHVQTAYDMTIEGIYCDVTSTTTYDYLGNAPQVEAPADADSFQLGYIKK